MISLWLWETEPLACATVLSWLFHWQPATIKTEFLSTEPLDLFIAGRWRGYFIFSCWQEFGVRLKMKKIKRRLIVSTTITNSGREIVTVHILEHRCAPLDTMRFPNVDSMPVQRLRRWPNIKSTLMRRVLFAVSGPTLAEHAQRLWGSAGSPPLSGIVLTMTTVSDSFSFLFTTVCLSIGFLGRSIGFGIWIRRALYFRGRHHRLSVCLDIARCSRPYIYQHANWWQLRYQTAMAADPSRRRAIAAFQITRTCWFIVGPELQMVSPH